MFLLSYLEAPERTRYAFSWAPRGRNARCCDCSVRIGVCYDELKRRGECQTCLSTRSSVTYSEHTPWRNARVALAATVRRTALALALRQVAHGCLSSVVLNIPHISIGSVFLQRFSQMLFTKLALFPLIFLSPNSYCDLAPHCHPQGHLMASTSLKLS